MKNCKTNLRIFIAVTSMSAALGLLAGCGVKGPNSTDLASETTSPSGAVRSVAINWTASKAPEVGLAGGGYKIYVRKGSAPSAVNTTPVIVNNAGSGVHTTTTSIPLTSGRYFVSIAAFSTNGDSPLTTAISVVVP